MAMRSGFVGIGSGGAVSGQQAVDQPRVGIEGLVLEVCAPRTPCRTFAAFLGARNWIRTFTHAGKPGAYLRVITPGPVCAGDTISVDHRPDHDVTVELAFRARTSEPHLAAKLLAAEALSAELKNYAHRRAAAKEVQ